MKLKTVSLMLFAYLVSVAALADTSNKSDIVFDTTVGGFAETSSTDAGAPMPGRVFVSFETIARDGKRKMDYAWITGQVGFSVAGDGVVLPTINVSIVPVLVHNLDLLGDCYDTPDKQTKCPLDLSLRVLPTEFHRQVAFGEQGSVVIHGVGVQGQLSSSEGRALIKAYVDLAGVRYMSMASSPDFYGIDLMSVGVQSKLTWTIFNQKLALSFYPFIAKGDVAYGTSGTSPNSMVFTGEILTRLEAALKTAYGTYGLYAEAGVQALIIERPDTANDVNTAWLGRLGFEVKF